MSIERMTKRLELLLNENAPIFLRKIFLILQHHHRPASSALWMHSGAVPFFISFSFNFNRAHFLVIFACSQMRKRTIDGEEIVISSYFDSTELQIVPDEPSNVTETLNSDLVFDHCIKSGQVKNLFFIVFFSILYFLPESLQAQKSTYQYTIVVSRKI